VRRSRPGRGRRVAGRPAIPGLCNEVAGARELQGGGEVRDAARDAAGLPEAVHRRVGGRAQPTVPGGHHVRPGREPLGRHRARGELVPGADDCGERVANEAAGVQVSMFGGVDAYGGVRDADAASGFRRPFTTPPAATGSAPTQHGSRRGRSASNPQAEDHHTSGKTRACPPTPGCGGRADPDLQCICPGDACFGTYNVNKYDCSMPGPAAPVQRLRVRVRAGLAGPCWRAVCG
jgi:hypothetical protein